MIVPGGNGQGTGLFYLGLPERFVGELHRVG